MSYRFCCATIVVIGSALLGTACGDAVPEGTASVSQRVDWDYLLVSTDLTPSKVQITELVYQNLSGLELEVKAQIFHAPENANPLDPTHLYSSALTVNAPVRLGTGARSVSLPQPVEDKGQGLTMVGGARPCPGKMKPRMITIFAKAKAMADSINAYVYRSQTRPQRIIVFLQGRPPPQIGGNSVALDLGGEIAVQSLDAGGGSTYTPPIPEAPETANQPDGGATCCACLAIVEGGI